MHIKLSEFKIYVKHLIKPTYLAWTGFGLAVIFAIQVFIVWKDGNRRVDRVIDKYTYIKDRIHIDKIQTESDRYTKVTTFYTEIAATYFQKYHPKYNKKDNTSKHYLFIIFLIFSFISIPVISFIVFVLYRV